MYVWARFCDLTTSFMLIYATLKKVDCENFKAPVHELYSETGLQLNKTKNTYAYEGEGLDVCMCFFFFKWWTFFVEKHISHTWLFKEYF